MEECLFCKITRKELPSEIVYEDDRFLVFKDIKPEAPVHVLLVPKKHLVSVNDIGEEDIEMIGELFLIAQKVAEIVGVKESGYKLVFNVGRGGGQLIDHLHLHLLGGWNNPKERNIPGMP